MIDDENGMPPEGRIGQEDSTTTRCGEAFESTVCERGGERDREAIENERVDRS